MSQSDSGTPDESEGLGPVARMMIQVAGQAITSYVQFRALCEVLIAKGVVTREELESRFELSREGELERTVDEWFTPDIAYHLRMAIQAAGAQDAGAEAAGGVAPPDLDVVERARRVQGG
ncbi:MAG TPA: hypothetical protein VFO85_15445 [Vicinamibacteria bacterium]|nr:hypothetical protein [Vicinamibacteria bacterium]